MNQADLETEIRNLRTELDALKASRSRPARFSGAKLRRVLNHRLGRLALIAAVLITPIAVYAAIVKPHTFTAGATISATEVNANFDTLYARVNGLKGFVVKSGTTVIGTYVSSYSGPKVSFFITDQGYFSGVFNDKAGSVSLGFLPSGTITYHTAADCSDTPLFKYETQKVVVDVGGSLYYPTANNPTAVPGYRNGFGSCGTNIDAGTQTTAEFFVGAANDPAVTGVPNSLTEDITVELQ